VLTQGKAFTGLDERVQGAGGRQEKGSIRRTTVL